MPKEIYIPQLGQTVESVTIVRWLLPDGAAVEPGQELLEVETDKAIFAIEATARGTLRSGPFAAGQRVPVLTVVGLIGAPGDAWPGQPAEAVPSDRAGVQPGVDAAGQATAGDLALPLPAAARPGRVFISPRARKLAAAHGIDLAQVVASGEGGKRVVERDVRVLIEAPPAGPPAAEAALPAEVIERIPLSGVRGVIAARMAASTQSAARVTLFSEVDATEFVAVVQRLRGRVRQEWGFPPAYSHLVLRIVALALRKFPYMNARIADGAIERLAQVHIGMAVESERGLLVPVVHDADTLSLREVGARLHTLLDQVKHNRIKPADLAGGTFTITDLSMFDVDAFTPIINLPEAAILGLGRIIAKPAVVDGQVLVRQMWTLSLAFDHRLTDGAPAARFLRAIKEQIEEPYLLIAG